MREKGEIALKKMSSIFQMALYKRGLILWVISSRLQAFFAGFLVFTFIFISSKDSSFLLTVSSMFQVFGFFMILMMYLQTGVPTGISINCLLSYLVVYICRAVAIMLEPGFLPEDASGDWFYRAMEIFGALIIIAILIIIWQSQYFETELEFDRFKCYFIFIFAIVAALIIRPSLSRIRYLNFTWVFSFYVETFAIIPQLMFFVNKVYSPNKIGWGNKRFHRTFCSKSWIFTYLQ